VSGAPAARRRRTAVRNAAQPCGEDAQVVRLMPAAGKGGNAAYFVLVFCLPRNAARAQQYLSAVFQLVVAERPAPRVLPLGGTRRQVLPA